MKGRKSRCGAISFWPKPVQFRLLRLGTGESSVEDVEFGDDRGAQEIPDDNRTSTRVNNDFDAWSKILRGSAEVPGVGTALLGYYDAARNNDVPGLGSNQSGSARSERRRRLGQLRLDSANEKFHDADGEIALTAEETDNTINAHGGRRV